MDYSRRKFFIQGASLAAAACLAQRVAVAADLPHVDEASPQATGLGYKHDATQIDAAKFPRYQAGQHCATCQLYTGAAGAEWGPCAIFPGQAVSAKGWCSAWVQKA